METRLGVSGVVGLVGLLLLGACGKSQRLPGVVGDEGGAGGAGGMPTTVDNGGEAGDGPKPDLPRPDEPPDVAAEIALIAGKSFNVQQNEGRNSLVAKDGQCEGDADDVAPFISDATYHFLKTGHDQLAVVVSFPKPWLRVESATLERTQSGWQLATALPTGVCIGHAFEEELGLARPTPERLSFDFHGLAALEAPTKLTISAVFEATDDQDAATLNGTGVLDKVAPKLFERPALQTIDNNSADPTYVVDYRFPWDPQSFSFSEALGPFGWVVTVTDEKFFAVGESIIEEDGAALGLVLDKYYPPSYHLYLVTSDLAGNEVGESFDMPGTELALSDGKFEATTPVANYARTFGEGMGAITTTAACAEDDSDGPACLASSAPNHPDIAALAGQSSLLVRNTAFLRIARSPGASIVRFDARLLSGALTALKVGTMSLDPGGPAGVKYLDATVAPLESDAESAVRTVTIPIPKGEGDVLVAVSGPDDDLEEEDALWLDSLRTE